MSEEQNINDNEVELLKAFDEQAPVEEYSVKEGAPLKPGTPKASREQIIEALRTICDPEIMINIYDLGLVYDIRQLDNGDVEIDMTLTAPTCPVAGVLPGQAATAVAALDGVGVATVNLVWEPAWSIDRLSDEAKALIEMF